MRHLQCTILSNLRDVAPLPNIIVQGMKGQNSMAQKYFLEEGDHNWMATLHKLELIQNFDQN